MLAEDSFLPEDRGSTLPTQVTKPPPIFLHGVLNFTDMMKSLKEVVEEEQFFTKILTNNVIKFVSLTPETYRKIVTHCKERNIYYHTYQLKEERAFRVVLKHLHYSSNLDDIKQELSSLGHVVRNIINVKHRLSKEPLNIFYIDIEPATNNKDIYAIKATQNKIIQFEPPNSTKHHIPQCMRCQQCGHTRKYCNNPFNCVKCGGPHNSETCPKSRDSPAKCALCGGSHPANYKGVKNIETYSEVTTPTVWSPWIGPYRRHKRTFPPYLLLVHNNLNSYNKPNVATQKWSASTKHPLMIPPPSSPPSSLNSEPYLLNWSNRMDRYSTC